MKHKPTADDTGMRDRRPSIVVLGNGMQGVDRGDESGFLRQMLAEEEVEMAS